MEHKTVLLEEAIELLDVRENKIYVDATLGGGGHSSLILEKLNNTGFLYCFDQDQYAIDYAKKRLCNYSNFTIIHSNFSNLKEKLNELGINKIDGIIYDLGVSSFQFDDETRGFSYRFDSILDMRMDKDNPLTAKFVVNNYSQEDLIYIFNKYGEEKFSYNIAKNIIEYRKQKEINTTFELVDIIKKSIPTKFLKGKGHPAKQVFQALRIEVNKELNVIEKSLNDAFEILNKDGKIVVISFHSLEDRIVKNLFKEKVTDYTDKKIPLKNIHFDYELLTKKPIVPNDIELESNNRSHSAKMRAIKKLV